MKTSFRFWAVACTFMMLASTRTVSAQNLNWKQADVNTILLGQEAIGFDAYNSGRLHDLLIVSSTNSILAGAEKGGVWLVSGNGSTFPLSNDWTRPDINTLAFGFGNQKHVFAGGSGLYVTDYNSGFPYLNWLDISPQGNALPSNAIIYKVATVTHDTDQGPKSYVVIATSSGIWTAELPPAPAGPYNWLQATGLPVGPYSGLAAGPDGSGKIAAGFFKAQSGFNGTSTPAIYQGTFDSLGILNLSAANINGTADTALQPGMIGYVSLDSCTLHAERMYAAVYDTSGILFDLLRSNDSGVKWVALSKTFDDGDPNNTLINWSKLLGDSGAGGWIKHISVAPTAPDVVSVPGLVSIRTDDGGGTWHSMGATWTKLGYLQPTTRCYHNDWHVIRFHPSNPLLMFAGTDGGLLNTFGALNGLLDYNHFYSTFNSRLHTLEFSSNPSRDFEGESDAEFAAVDGLFAGGLQDNGDVFVQMNPGATGPWTQYVGGDGAQNQFFNAAATYGWVLNSYIGFGPSQWNPLVATAFNNVPPFMTSFTITPPVKKDPNGKKRPEGLNCAARAVYRPTFKKGNKFMFVVGGEATIGPDSFPNSIFGLFVDPSKQTASMEWEHLGDLPVTVATVTAFDGDPVVCGGADGNIYTLDPKNGNVQMMLMNAPFQNGVAYRILYRLPALPLCSYNSFAGNNPKSAVLQFNGVAWNKIFGLNEAIQDIAVDESVNPEAIYVATDNRVYSSADAGKTWVTDSKGLPERFHGSQLKIVRYSNGEKWLYLTTYGRSVWAANMAGGPFTH